jgi:outer membrane lipoprotein-sorting protein
VCINMGRSAADSSDLSTKGTAHVRSALTLLLLACMGLQLPATAQSVTVPAPLSTEQVVQNLVRMNAERAQEMRSYQGKRIYRLEYHGFPGARNAEMVVDVKYQSPGTKEFTIQSETGSKLIIDRVFKKLLQSEKEALDAENLRRTALNEENYVFTLLGYENASEGSMYVLSVDPRRKDKFLYSGRIWVDAQDFAVVRIEAEPAKNPSFWTKNTKIEHRYVKVNDFWLPAQNHSLTSVRLGGRADLTIEYMDYQVTPAHLPGKPNDAALH